MTETKTDQCMHGFPLAHRRHCSGCVVSVLEQEIENLESKLKIAVEALETYSESINDDPSDVYNNELAIKALAKIRGENENS